MAEFIFMLTYNDVTREDAIEIYQEIRNTELKFIGFKDIGLPYEKLHRLASMIKEDNRQLFLEVVTTSEADNVKSTQVALDLGADYLIGGTYINQTLSLIECQDMKYFPYIGQIVGHPCRLRGAIAEIVEDGGIAEALGVDGVNLLGYRYDGNVEELIKSVQESLNVPLVVAGSINSFARIQKMVDLDVWAFTIGGAIFDRKFNPEGSYPDNINAVLKKINAHVGF